MGRDYLRNHTATAAPTGGVEGTAGPKACGEGGRRGNSESQDGGEGQRMASEGEGECRVPKEGRREGD